MFYTLDKNNENIKCQLQTETNLDNLPKNESVEKSKKRKSKNSNKQSIKKIITINNNSPQIEAVDKKLELSVSVNQVKLTNKTNQINEDSNSGVIESKTFEKKIKKKKNKQTNDNSTKPNDKIKKIDKKLSTTNSS